MLSVRVKQETLNKVQALAKSKRISQGEVIDELINGNAPVPVDPKMTGVLCYLVPVNCADDLHKKVEG